MAGRVPETVRGMVASGAGRAPSRDDSGAAGFAAVGCSPPVPDRFSGDSGRECRAPSAVVTARSDGGTMPEAFAATRSGAVLWDDDGACWSGVRMGDDTSPPGRDWVCGRPSDNTSERTGCTGDSGCRADAVDSTRELAPGWVWAWVCGWVWALVWVCG
ncbi:hypothetical protein [Amycolatopsis regifaucium]|uniref:hypothetical protein n=1 Tax=Amycolatopsis regifaucium TaxID=546365 RepID=UPI0011600E81|nr:hypothetical protein [Amycolatopsis regifaucium]